MLKLGILRREQFLRYQAKRRIGRLFSLSTGRVSFRLLERPSQPATQDSEIFERLMPYVQLSSGTYRTTYRGRFRNLDSEVNQLLTRIFDPQKDLKVEDWAASACLTSSEWADALFPLFARLSFVASDILLFLIEVQDGKRYSYVFEPDGAPLQLVKSPFVIRMTPPEPRALPLNRWLCTQAWSRWNALQPFSDSVHRWIASPSKETLNADGMKFAKLSLIHPEAERLAERDARFTIQAHSVFESLSSPAHVIRTMNIFNNAYFSEQQLKVGAQAVIGSLLPRGIWILGRTVCEAPPAHEVTIFRKDSFNRLEVLRRLGSGSEIEKLVLSHFGA